MIPVDELDLEILRKLSENARSSFREMSKELSVSLATVSNRVRKLEENGIIRGYTAILDEQKLGFDLSAIIGIRISSGELIEVQERIADDARVYGVYDITGEWDSLVFARFKNREDLNDFVKHILSFEHVERTNTFLVLNKIKDAKGLVL